MTLVRGNVIHPSSDVEEVINNGRSLVSTLHHRITMTINRLHTSIIIQLGRWSRIIPTLISCFNKYKWM